MTCFVTKCVYVTFSELVVAASFVAVRIRLLVVRQNSVADGRFSAAEMWKRAMMFNIIVTIGCYCAR